MDTLWTRTVPPAPGILPAWIRASLTCDDREGGGVDGVVIGLFGGGQDARDLFIGGRASVAYSQPSCAASRLQGPGLLLLVRLPLPPLHAGGWHRSA